MNARTLRVSLWCVAVAGLIAGILAIILAAAMPLVRPTISSGIDSRASGSKTSGLAPAISFSDVSNLDLRRPLVDRVVYEQTPADSPPADALPPVQLVGTIVEPGHSFGLFADSDGQVEFKSVGDEVAGAKIFAIATDSVTLIWNDKQVVVSLPATANPPDLTLTENSVVPSAVAQKTPTRPLAQAKIDVRESHRALNSGRPLGARQ